VCRFVDRIPLPPSRLCKCINLILLPFKRRRGHRLLEGYRVKFIHFSLFYYPFPPFHFHFFCYPFRFCQYLVSHCYAVARLVNMYIMDEGGKTPQFCHFSSSLIPSFNKTTHLYLYFSKSVKRPRYLYCLPRIFNIVAKLSYSSLFHFNPRHHAALLPASIQPACSLF